MKDMDLGSIAGRPIRWLERYEEISVGSVSIIKPLSSSLYIYVHSPLNQSNPPYNAKVRNKTISFYFSLKL